LLAISRFSFLDFFYLLRPSAYSFEENACISPFPGIDDDELNADVIAILIGVNLHKNTAVLVLDKMNPGFEVFYDFDNCVSQENLKERGHVVEQHLDSVAADVMLELSIIEIGQDQISD
jgi:hypothetical protein